MAKASGFIERHGLWTDDQRRLAKALAARVKKEKLKLFRVAWADPHGASRAKTVTLPAFLDALKNGYNINVATTTLDASGARTFASFTRGGGMDLDEMTGSPNLIIVPDPGNLSGASLGAGCRLDFVRRIFRLRQAVLFFAAATAAEADRAPARKRDATAASASRSNGTCYSSAEQQLTLENIGAPGLKGRAPNVCPVEPGYSFHSETNLDLMQAPLSAVADALEKLNLPLGHSRMNGVRDRWNAPSRPAPRSKRPTISFFSAPRRARSAGASVISRPSCAGRHSKASTRAAGICTNR